MVEVYFGIGIRIATLFSAVYAVNMSALQVGGCQYTLIFLFYANIAKNRDNLDDLFPEFLGIGDHVDCYRLYGAADCVGARNFGNLYGIRPVLRGRGVDAKQSGDSEEK